MQRQHPRQLLAGLALLCGVAIAQDRPATALPAETKISLSQAIAIAEKHLDGQAIEASLEHSAAGLRYEIEIQKGSREYEVHIDATSGKVLGTAPQLFD